VNDIKIETINQYMFYVVQLMKNYDTGRIVLSHQEIIDGLISKQSII